MSANDPADESVIYRAGHEPSYRLLVYVEDINSVSEGIVRVAIIGVGNGASTSVKGVECYKNASKHDFVPGLVHVDLSGFHVRDIEITAAFDMVEQLIRETSTKRAVIETPAD